MLEHRAFSPGDIRVRHFLERHSKCLDDEVIDRDFVSGLAINIRRALVDVFAQRHQLVEFAINREVEMRDRLLGFDQTTRNRLAHRVMRDLFIAAGLEQLLDLFITHGRCHWCARRRCSSRRSLQRATGHCSLHIALHNTAMRAGARDARHINASFFRKTLGER